MSADIIRGFTVYKFCRTSDCFQCGMIEDVGQLDIKICGDISCCFIQHLDNGNLNFQAGSEDRFDGSGGLLQCNNLQVIMMIIR